MILFSLGQTGFNSGDLPADLMEVFVQAFSSLDGIGVIMKCNPESWNPNKSGPLPKNVLMKQWLPQQDILGRYYLFNDQFDNARRVKEKAFGQVIWNKLN